MRIKYKEIELRNNEEIRPVGAFKVERMNSTSYVVDKKLHRLGGPAQIYHNTGKEIWCFEGDFHRDRGPAVIQRHTGIREYWKHGKLHRENGPAKIDPHGLSHWYFEGKLHRSDGPAVHPSSGHRGMVEYYIHGKRFDREEFERSRIKEQVI